MANKVIQGTKDKKRFEVIKGEKDTRAIRCTDPKCRNVARQVPDGKGGLKFQCGTCLKVFSFTRI